VKNDSAPSYMQASEEAFAERCAELEAQLDHQHTAVAARRQQRMVAYWRRWRLERAFTGWLVWQRCGRRLRAAVEQGLGRIVALYHRSSTFDHIH
jgi:hypothetical protein